jgi:hypothetical protein
MVASHRSTPQNPTIDATVAPLDFMLSIMMDSAQPQPLRERIAIMVAPYLHDRTQNG